MGHDKEIVAAVEEYSKAMIERLKAKAEYHKASLRNTTTLNNLNKAKDRLRILEIDLHDGIMLDGIIPKREELTITEHHGK